VKEFTHYSVVLIDSGPREGVVKVLAEITGLSPDKVKRQIRELPWEIATGIPLNEAQEIKILMETNRAVVRLKGVDIWEGETGILEKSRPAPLPVKSINKKQISIFIAVFAVFVIGLTYLVMVLSGSGKDAFLSKLDVDITESKKESISENPEAAIQSINAKTELQTPQYNLRDEGATPYKREVAIRFDLPYESPVTLSIYDKSFSCIAVLLQGTLKPDSYRVRWQGITDVNTSVVPGVYIVQLSTPTGNCYHKIVWLASGK